MNSPSPEIDDRRGDMPGRRRASIRKPAPEIVEEVKRRKPSSGMPDGPAREHAGIPCVGETCRDKIEPAFARGAPHPASCAAT
jgi:hypothetical protein